MNILIKITYYIGIILALIGAFFLYIRNIPTAFVFLTFGSFFCLPYHFITYNENEKKYYLYKPIKKFALNLIMLMILFLFLFIMNLFYTNEEKENLSVGKLLQSQNIYVTIRVVNKYEIFDYYLEYN